VMEFILKNADKYNFDVKKIVVGGTSRGSFITWEYSHKNPDIVKGIYSTGALGDPAMWKEETRFLTSRDPRDDIHTGSPPLLFAFPDMLGDVNVHSPRSGVLIKERYEELGIGHKARVEHSLSKRNLGRWAFIVDFIMEVITVPLKSKKVL
jgi:pimeloyl-ACP methyl ester carboxylesterase